MKMIIEKIKENSINLAVLSFGILFILVSLIFYSIEYEHIELTNSNGSVSKIQLRRLNFKEWSGPNGERYEDFPTQEQLSQLYSL